MRFFIPFCLLILAACTPASPVAELPPSATVAPTASPSAPPRATPTMIPRATAIVIPTATATATATPTATPSATTEPTASATTEPTASATTEPTVEPTVELSAVDATQVANATATAEARPPAASAPPAPAGTPAPLPTASDGRVPKAQEPGFTLSIVANSAEEPIIHPTSLAWGPDGALYVSRMEGPILRIAPDGTRRTFAEGFAVPVGLAFRPGTNLLYVAHRGGVTTLRDADGDGVAEERHPFLTGMPCCYADLHQSNGLQFGPDGWLYLAQGSSSDHGEAPDEPWHAGILRVHPDQGQASLAYVATGTRNPYDLVVRPNGQIFATDNGADYGPPEELNHILPGEDYGWPGCVSPRPGEVGLHPAWNDPARCEGSRAAIATFPAHASANGITSYEASLFPPAYRGNLFVALWSHIPDAYRIVRVQLTPAGDSFTTTVTPFVTEFELPLDVAVGPDGALYVADWGPGRIYRIGYGP